MFNNSKKIIERNSKIIYYDCTNYFFEIDQDDDLRKYGISREHRPNPIVGMGLFMDGDGLPLSFNIYPGNKNKSTKKYQIKFKRISYKIKYLFRLLR